ncbi:hypothetical protein ABID16_002136 [Rhizobium aquaticum]|uniref:Uncharacterized protein n=1 Tax=Rhizobium aquaticum TaxID=1549636 RepID=A0ABV2IZ82_9HYPH
MQDSDLKSLYQDIYIYLNSHVSNLLYVAVASVVLVALMQALVGRMYATLRLSVLSPVERRKSLEIEEVEALRRKIENEKDKEKKLELEALRASLKSQFEENLKDSLRYKDGQPTSNWKEVLIQSRSRLIEEEDRLSSRSSTNLIYGIIFSAFSLIIIFVILVIFPASKIPENWYEFAAYYGSRFTFIIISQILASFFLKMYVSNEKDILKNKNEITNIELRLTAGLMASDKDSQLNAVSAALSKEERNFIIGKGEKIAPDFNKETTTMVIEIVEAILKHLPNSGRAAKDD